MNEFTRKMDKEYIQVEAMYDQLKATLSEWIEENPEYFNERLLPAIFNDDKNDLVTYLRGLDEIEADIVSDFCMLGIIQLILSKKDENQDENPDGFSSEEEIGDN